MFTLNPYSDYSWRLRRRATASDDFAGLRRADRRAALGDLASGGDWALWCYRVRGWNQRAAPWVVVAGGSRQWGSLAAWRVALVSGAAETGLTAGASGCLHAAGVLRRRKNAVPAGLPSIESSHPQMPPPCMASMHLHRFHDYFWPLSTLKSQQATPEFGGRKKVYAKGLEMKSKYLEAMMRIRENTSYLCWCCT